MRFNPSNIEDLSMCVSTEMLERALESMQGMFTHDIFKGILEYVDNDMFLKDLLKLEQKI